MQGLGPRATRHKGSRDTVLGGGSLLFADLSATWRQKALLKNSLTPAMFGEERVYNRRPGVIRLHIAARRFSRIDECGKTQKVETPEDFT